MTVSVYEYNDASPAGDEPIEPALRVTKGAPLSTFIPLGDPLAGADTSIRAIRVYNNSSTTGVHLAIVGSNDAGSVATQNDQYLGPDATAQFLIKRQNRDSTKGRNPLYLYALADT